MYFMSLTRLGFFAVIFAASPNVMNGVVMIRPKASWMASEPSLANLSQFTASSGEKPSMTSRVPWMSTG